MDTPTKPAKQSWSQTIVGLIAAVIAGLTMLTFIGEIGAEPTTDILQTPPATEQVRVPNSSEWNMVVVEQAGKDFSVEVRTKKGEVLFCEKLKAMGSIIIPTFKDAGKLHLVILDFDDEEEWMVLPVPEGVSKKCLTWILKDNEGRPEFFSRDFDLILTTPAK